MDDVIITKNLLLNKTCQTCKSQKTVDDGRNLCVRYLGESVGWQWWPQNKKNTCEDWNE